MVFIKTIAEKPKQCKDCPCCWNVSRRGLVTSKCPILWREVSPCLPPPGDCPLGEFDLEEFLKGLQS